MLTSHEGISVRTAIKPHLLACSCLFYIQSSSIKIFQNLISSLPNDFQCKKVHLNFERALSPVSLGVYLQYHNNLQYLSAKNLMWNNQICNLFGERCSGLVVVIHPMSPSAFPEVRAGTIQGLSLLLPHVVCC